MGLHLSAPPTPGHVVTWPVIMLLLLDRLFRRLSSSSFIWNEIPSGYPVFSPGRNVTVAPFIRWFSTLFNSKDTVFALSSGHGKCGKAVAILVQERYRGDCESPCIAIALLMFVVNYLVIQLCFDWLIGGCFIDADCLLFVTAPFLTVIWTTYCFR